MRISVYIASAVIALALLTAPAYAGNPCAANPCAANPCAQKQDYRAMHKQMKKEHLGMFKEVIVILRDLNHKPSAAQKQQLNEMIGKLDKMIEQCDTGMMMHKKKGKGMRGM
jgi:hypothetical protein